MLNALVFLGWMFSRPPLISKEALSPHQTRAAFEITKQLIRTQTTEDMHRLCAAGDDIRGCTKFVGETLVPEYSSSAPDRWTVRLNGGMVALIIVHDADVVGHELRHIDDMRASVDKLLAAEEARSYPSREACVAAANAMIGSFRHRLAAIAAESNARLQ